MRVRVQQRSGLPQNIAPLELLDDEGIGGLHEPSAHDGHVGGKLAARVHRLNEREPVSLARRVVIGAERRRHVHDAGAIIRRNEILANDHAVVTLDAIERDPIEWALVARSDERGPGEPSHRVPSVAVVLTEHARRAGLGENDRPIRSGALPELDVDELGVHGERDVGNEGPGSGGPDEDASSGIPKVQRNVYARITHILVA